MRSNEPMTIDQIRLNAPAVFATEGHPDRVSSQYSFVSTEEVLMGMLEAGYGVFRAQQKHTRQSEDMKYTRHILGFRPIKNNIAPRVGDTTPEVLLISAHDAKCSFNLVAGLFRFVCANGLIVGQNFQTIRTPHKGDIVEYVKEGAAKVMEFVPQLQEFYEKCSNTSMSKGKMHEYAQRAMAIRHGGQTPYVPADLLNSNRTGDDGFDLWHVFQRVQENLMRGGIEGQTASGRRSVSRPINRVTKDVIYNRALWDLTEEYAEAA